jgi:hypothetical protein
MDLPFDRLKEECMNEYKHINVAAGRWLDTPSLKHGTCWRNNMNMWIGFKSTERILSGILWAFVKVYFLTSETCALAYCTSDMTNSCTQRFGNILSIETSENRKLKPA